MKRIKSFKVFNRVESRLRVFESFDDTLDIVSNIKDMLLELSDLDYTTNCVIRRMDSKEYIRIGISKATSYNTHKGRVIDSFTYEDIKEYMTPIREYLSSEGFDWNFNKGTHGQPPKYGDAGPYVNSTGSAFTNQYTSRIEMWFERGFDEFQSNKIKYGFGF